MKKYFLVIFVLLMFPFFVNADGEMYWAVNGTKCTSKSESCTLVLSNSEIEGEHYAHGTFTNTIEWADYTDSIVSIQIGKENDLIKISNGFKLFEGLSRVSSVDLKYLDTSELTTTSYMFTGLTNVKKLNVSSLNTANVVDMSYMFSGLEILEELTINGLNTSNVTNMSYMFYNLNLLKKLDVSSLNTSKVTNMQGMFNGLFSVTELNLSGIDTSNVTDMSYMFVGLYDIKELDVSSLNTSKVTTMQEMFSAIDQIVELDLSNFDTSKVTNMSSMFTGNYALEYINLSSFDTSSVTTMESMFEMNQNLSIIVVSDKWTTANVVNSSYMFSNDENLIGEYGTKFDSDKVDKEYAIIDTSEDVGYFWATTPQVIYFSAYGEHCDLDYSCTLKISNKPISGAAFYSGKTYAQVPWANLLTFTKNIIVGGENDIIKPISTKNWFNGANRIHVLDLTYLDTSKVLDMDGMFIGSNILRIIKVSDRWNTSKVKSSKNMFWDCTKIIGMNGTEYDENKLDKEYARVDGNSKGYFWNNTIQTSNQLSLEMVEPSMYNSNKLKIRFEKKPLNALSEKITGSNSGSILEFNELKYIDNNGNVVNYYNDWKYVDAYYTIKEIKEANSVCPKLSSSTNDYYADCITIQNMNNAYVITEYFSNLSVNYVDADNIKITTDEKNKDIVIAIKEDNSDKYIYKYATTDNNGEAVIKCNISGEYYYAVDLKNNTNPTIWSNRYYYYHEDPNVYAITTESDHAEVSAPSSAKAGELVSFLVVPHSGYMDDKVTILRKVRTKVGNSYVYSFVDVSKNVNYENAHFTMPNYPVIIKVETVSILLSTPSITIAKGNGNSLILNINEQNAAQKYIIYRSTNNKKWSKLAETTNTTYTNTGLTYGTTYYYKVVAYNKYVGHSGYSSVVSKKVVPDKVNNLRISGVGQKSIKVAWDKVSVTGYEVYMNNKKTATISKNSTLSYNKTKLNPNKTYSFKVRAYKTVKGKKIYGAFSDTISGLTAPATPKITSVGLRDYNALNVNVKGVGGATKYEIVRSTSKKGTYNKIGEITSAGTYVDNNLNTGTTYYYKVRACNKNNNCSAYSSIVSKKVIPLTPKNITKEVNYYSIKLKLSSVNGADGYEIQRSTNKKRGYKSVKTTSELEWNNTKLSSNKTYYYKVRAYKLVNGKKVFSSFSSIITAKTKAVSKIQKKALDKAKSYLKYLSFSAEGLIKQLEYHKFSHADAVFAVTYCGANWNEQAVKSAKSYIKYLDFSYDGLISQLEYEGFTHEQAVYGANRCGANFDSEVVKSAKSYVQNLDFSYTGLIGQLEYEGFTHEQAVYGANNCGANWNEEALSSARSYISYLHFDKQELINQLKYEGFTDSEINYAINALGM